jgi:hypothetical protein
MCKYICLSTNKFYQFQNLEAKKGKVILQVKFHHNKAKIKTLKFDIVYLIFKHTYDKFLKNLKSFGSKSFHR